MDITQSFYDNLASQYHKLFQNWQATTDEQAQILDKLFRACGFDQKAQILDCACGIGTQAIGLAAMGYSVTASDISDKELAEARLRAQSNHVFISFAHTDFRELSQVFSQTFDIVICMDNALPHMLCTADLEAAVKSITGRLAPGGLFVASIRDYDALLLEKPSYAPPYIHETAQGQCVCFQTWRWKDDHYQFTQYIIEDEESLQVSKFHCQYRAVRREELTRLLMAHGCNRVEWKFPEETGFYQPIVVAQKSL